MSSSTTSEHHSSKTNKTSSKGRVEEPTSSTSVEQPTVAKKWQPRKMKSARTLCTYRWLKQVNEDGSTTQFNEYWKHLKKDQKAVHLQFLHALVSNDGWNDFSATVINSLSSGMVY
ncbi:hypothetical protein PAXRUDRAFT_168109 [Paxillus rubicundulus Ve08.2h10]|uniref:Uncharacterized protein n=1 Tax=Paxillus rubicundulus Ve08.2h10 TaxID=930991 RepID=A0A0D0CP17_9AGAM|nr:hypothetical protein PAXRUDRAFT_168109 [Paxillus rubicundulus Ve08.2h10]